MPESTVTPDESREAFEARLGGHTLRQIADVLGLSIEGTRKALLRESHYSVVKHAHGQRCSRSPTALDEMPVRIANQAPRREASNDAR